MSEGKLKVLVLNPISSNLEKAVQIVNLQNKKAGPFAFSIFLGDILGNSEEDIQLLTPDIPIYFTSGENKINPEHLKNLNSNFHYLGEIGIFKLVSGLKIGFISGHITDITGEQIDNKFKNQTNIDILITYQWPEAIAKEEKNILSGDKKLDVLINTAKPRYWFSAGGTVKGKFFEREAYKIDEKITRFVSLATMNEGRWWYAFNINIDPDDDLNTFQNMKIGTSPIVTSISNLPKRPIESVSGLNNKNKKSKLRATEVTPSSCFLCLANPSFELHMVISVANLSYLTISKGPLTLKKPLGFSGHGMIVPIEHYPTLRKYVYEKQPNCKVENSEIYLEINKFQESLAKMFKTLGDYSIIFWEISRLRSVHCHLQFVPIPNNIIPYFEKTLKNQIKYDKKMYPEGLEYTKYDESADMSDLYEIINSEDYVMFTLYEKFGITKYVIKLGNDENRYFDAQFPRKVMAVLLNLKNRIRWDKCTETIDEENTQKTKFQEAYRPFDIMIHGDN